MKSCRMQKQTFEDITGEHLEEVDYMGHVELTFKM